MSEVSAKVQTSVESTSVENIKESAPDEASTEKPDVANDVQRAIEGLKDIPDDELQEFLNDEDFMKDLDVVDAWEGDNDKAGKDSKGARAKERGDHSKASRERPRRERKSPYNRDRLRRDERKQEDVRRDPSKSSKDIERDKIRTKKETDSKILAEKEKAIKYLLDSDDIVPPGTEVEAIQNIMDKQQNSERGQPKSRRSRDRRRSRERSRPSPGRRRSNDRIRLSPHRRISDERRQIRISPERRRNPPVSPGLRRSWERRASRDRSSERHRRREEREFARLVARRTRSRDRQRSRSFERYRKRWSRSPLGRRSSTRRSRSRSRTPDRRARKRSPFINEITRQFEKEGLLTSNFLPGIPPLMGQGYAQGQSSPVPPPPPPQMSPFMHHPAPPRPSGMSHSMQLGQQFVNFEPRPPIGPPVNFEPARATLMPMPQPDYAAGPVLYGQTNPPGLMQLPGQGPSHLPMPMHSPQPVPAPLPMEHSPMSFNQSRCIVNITSTAQHQQPEQTNRRPVSPRMPYKELKSASSNYHVQRPERLKTPEPPIISNSKPFEKTSLSSLLEASVSAKDSHGPPVLYPGFKPEILRNCEQALRELPSEDQRLKLKGRFFFDPSKQDSHVEPEGIPSNSILLRTGRNKIYWEESEKIQTIPEARSAVETHQICQTDEIETDSKAVQAHLRPSTADFCMQVSVFDLQQAAKEEKRPIMDRLDWNVRETYDYAPKIREADDLRWSLSNSSQKRAWNNRGVSPVRVIEKERELSPTALSMSDHGSRGMHVGSSTRSRDNFSFHRSSSREHYSRDRFSPSYRGSIDRQVEFHESRSDRSRGESPMVLEDSPDEIEILDERYPRSSDWRSRGKSSYSSSSALQKFRSLRGKTSGRSHRGRGSGSFRGKF